MVMGGADFKCEVKNSALCHDVASLLLFINFLFSIRNGIPVFHLPKLSIFIAVTPLLTEIFKFLYYDIIDQDSSRTMSMNNRFYPSCHLLAAMSMS